jgi:hypothetical protein
MQSEPARTRPAGVQHWVAFVWLCRCAFGCWLLLLLPLLLLLLHTGIPIAIGIIVVIIVI